jgi:hypothetical protein
MSETKINDDTTSIVSKSCEFIKKYYLAIILVILSPSIYQIIAVTFEYHIATGIIFSVAMIVLFYISTVLHKDTITEQIVATILCTASLIIFFSLPYCLEGFIRKEDNRIYENPSFSNNPWKVDDIKYLKKLTVSENETFVEDNLTKIVFKVTAKYSIPVAGAPLKEVGEIHKYIKEFLSMSVTLDEKNRLVDNIKNSNTEYSMIPEIDIGKKYIADFAEFLYNKMKYSNITIQIEKVDVEIEVQP